MNALECQESLGMESGAIADGQISASSEWSNNHAAHQGRLNFKRTGSKNGAWSAGTSNANQWLQVDLVSYYTRVTRVATQGRNGANAQWVTRYYLQYGNNGVNFRYYREQGQTASKVKNLIHRNIDNPYFIETFKICYEARWPKWLER